MGFGSYLIIDNVILIKEGRLINRLQCTKPLPLHVYALLALIEFKSSTLKMCQNFIQVGEAEINPFVKRYLRKPLYIVHVQLWRHADERPANIAYHNLEDS